MMSMPGYSGEAWLGAAKGLSYVVGIFPGTGVGGAVICDGKLILGLQGAATEFGHVIVKLDGSFAIAAIAGVWRH